MDTCTKDWNEGGPIKAYVDGYEFCYMYLYLQLGHVHRQLQDLSRAEHIDIQRIL